MSSKCFVWNSSMWMTFGEAWGLKPTTAALTDKTPDFPDSCRAWGASGFLETLTSCQLYPVLTTAKVQNSWKLEALAFSYLRSEFLEAKQELQHHHFLSSSNIEIIQISPSQNCEITFKSWHLNEQMFFSLAFWFADLWCVSGIFCSNWIKTSNFLFANQGKTEIPVQ